MASKKEEMEENNCEFNVGSLLGLNLPDGFEYEILILYNSFTIPIDLKMEKSVWVRIVNSLLDKDDSKCNEYMEFLDNLYSDTLDSMGGIGGKLSIEASKEIYSSKIKSIVICSIINLIHFEKIPDDNFNGFMFCRMCKQEEANKNGKLVSDFDLCQKDISDYLSCFNCGCYKHHSEMKRCGRCLNVCYCGKECQMQHWDIHKQKCKTLPLSEGTKKKGKNKKGKKKG